MKITKVMMSLFLCLLSLTTYAQAIHHIAIKTDGNVTYTQEKLIANVFIYLNKFWADKGESLSMNTTKEYFTPNTTLVINGKTVYQGYNQFNAHFKEVGKSIIGKIHFPLLELMGVGNNKLVVHFNEDIHDNNGKHYPANVFAIFTLYKGRIQRWEEVVNTKYFCQAEAEKAVYSH